MMVDKSRCPIKQFREAPIGLGDTIHAITSALRIPECGGCAKRRQRLNQLFPYGKKPEETKGETHDP